MDKEIIRSVAVMKGLKNVELFVEFFSRRFPNEDDRILSYVDEWADRFKGDPTGHMDAMSLSIYNEVKK